MFEKVTEADFIRGEHQALKFWTEHRIFEKLREKNYMSRDSRMRERKKYGLHGARRGTQFSKR